MLTMRRDKTAAKLYFRRTIKKNGKPKRFVIDKSEANLVEFQRIKVDLKFLPTHRLFEIFGIKYLNRIVEQDHRFITKVTRHALGFKAFYAAAAKQLCELGSISLARI